MKRTIILAGIIFMTCSQLIYAQIGINTKNPEHPLHIDPAHNNDANLNDATSKQEDIVFTTNGTLGIGTVKPDTKKKLHVLGNAKVSNNLVPKDTILIQGKASTKRIGVGTTKPEADLHVVNNNNNISLQISDGSEKLGYILTADQDGRAYWDGLRPMSSIVFGSLKADVRIDKKEVPNNITGDSLSLAPGRWLIVAKSAMANRNLGGFNVYMDLKAENGFNGEVHSDGTPVTVATAASAGETQGAKAASPNIVYVVNVEKKPGTTAGSSSYNSKFWITLRSSGVESTGDIAVTSSNYGEMQFYAIRIDRPGVTTNP